LSAWRKLVCSALIVVLPTVVLPTSLMAQDPGRAMLHSDGEVWVNGTAAPAPNSSAIFLHDTVQTQRGSKAKIDADGSMSTLQPDTIVQFEGNELLLDHGRLQVNTSKGMRVRVNCMTVIPLTQQWTSYDVIDVDGKVLVVAYANDVNIHYQGAAAHRSKLAGSPSDATVHQGEQATREERCGAAAKPPVINASGPALNSLWAKGAGLAAVGIIACVFLCRGSGGSEPLSPSQP
jgi:hypothetical protein